MATYASFEKLKQNDYITSGCQARYQEISLKSII